MRKKRRHVFRSLKHHEKASGEKSTKCVRWLLTIIRDHAKRRINRSDLNSDTPHKPHFSVKGKGINNHSDAFRVARVKPKRNECRKRRSLDISLALVKNHSLHNLLL